MIRHIVVAAAITGAAVQASAQTPPPPSTVEFLPRASFYLGAEHLSGDDEQFVWDADIGGQVDLLDYVAGRAIFFANYETVLGEEFRAFDPNQGNYILEGSASLRLRGVELAGVFYHQSRHLSDRPKRPPVDWNMLAVRVRGQREIGRAHLDVRVDLRDVIKRSFVDYSWELDSGLHVDVPVARRVAIVAGSALRVMAVDGTAARGTQTGFRAEGGLRIDGSGAAVELFVAAERRIDPYPLQFGTATWATAGFRLLSR